MNHADCGSEWFDLPGSFFRCFQGNGNQELFGRRYKGAPILQSAPLFPCIGNHEVMRRWTMKKSLDFQLNDPFPRELVVAEQSETQFVKDHTFNTDSYEEIFSLPNSLSKGKYYAVTFGNIRLVVLYATRIWRPVGGDRKSRYGESPKDYPYPKKWGQGVFIFESIEPGSNQYRWLEQELQSKAYQQAKYKIVMLHHPMHSLGAHIVPPFTNPEQTIKRNCEYQTTAVSYHYPKEKDQLMLLEPLFEKHGVHLVLCGHSHIWNRFQKKGVHYLETSNVGNSYGAYIDHSRLLIPYEDDNYIGRGDPNGLDPILPTLAPLEENGKKLPYISSDTITAFSIFDTESGAIDSYYYDCEKQGEVVHFDRFYLDCSCSSK